VHCSPLRYLELGLTPMSWPALERIHATVVTSSLFFFSLLSVQPRHTPVVDRLDKQITDTLTRNVVAHYGDITYEEFLEGPLRFVRNTEDVRYIDSVYRTRDMEKARRGLMVLKKWWDPEDRTLAEVANI